MKIKKFVFLLWLLLCVAIMTEGQKAYNEYVFSGKDKLMNYSFRLANGYNEASEILVINSRTGEKTKFVFDEEKSNDTTWIFTYVNKKNEAFNYWFEITSFSIDQVVPSIINAIYHVESDIVLVKFKRRNA